MYVAYYLYPPRQTAATALRDRSHLAAGLALAGAASAATAAVGHGSPAAAGRDHSLQAEAIQDPFCCLVSSRTGYRSVSRCMRRAGVCCRILHHHHLLHNDRRAVCRISGWEQVEEACCSRVAQSWCAADVRRFATSWPQPERTTSAFALESGLDKRHAPVQARRAWAAGLD